VILLSFALADKIKILQQEESASRERAIVALKENERIVREQNIFLEEKVQERTLELTSSNTELNHTLTKLKDTQAQLIESEKLASLGQLTAGIAHEINNPINFVSANIKPLKRDIQDLLDVLSKYENIDQASTLESIQTKLKSIDKFKNDLDIGYIKEELDLLLKGIEEGAHRTVDIVKGLKNFSRLDETDINSVNINEGIESTLILLNNQIGDRINVTRNLGNIPPIECYPGKLNQVFMNILSNAIYAVTEKPLNHGTKPSIWITTAKQDSEHIKLTIKDNGVGMTPEVKAKIFDPFFTTKDVGKGSGLGMSIVFKIIEAHNGTIDVITEPNNGAEFVITLPLSSN
jgi:signal transduction histidine kinase